MEIFNKLSKIELLLKKTHHIVQVRLSRLEDFLRAIQEPYATQYLFSEGHNNFPLFIQQIQNHITKFLDF